MDHENGCSPVPQALYIDWSFSCGSRWDIFPRECALIKDSSSGHFSTASCGHWPPFHPWACSYTTALLLGLPVTPTKSPGVVTWLQWLLTCPGSYAPSPPVGELVRMITDSARVTCAPPKWRLCPLAFEGRIFQVDSVKTSCQKQPTLCVILKRHSCSIIHVEKVSATRKLSKLSITCAIVTVSKLVIEGTCLVEPLPRVQACAAWVDTSRIITLLRRHSPWALCEAISSMLWFIFATRQTGLRGAP